VRSSFPVSRAVATAWAKSGEAFTRFRTACREMPAASADSRIVDPSASFARITRPRQSKFMAGDYRKSGLASITRAAGRGESDNRRVDFSCNDSCNRTGHSAHFMTFWRTSRRTIRSIYPTLFHQYQRHAKKWEIFRKIPGTGLEPAQMNPPDPKSGASTNSATPAFGREVTRLRGWGKLAMRDGGNSRRWEILRADSNEARARGSLRRGGRGG
jgi:hypothetical protein